MDSFVNQSTCAQIQGGGQVLATQVQQSNVTAPAMQQNNHQTVGSNHRRNAAANRCNVMSVQTMSVNNNPVPAPAQNQVCWSGVFSYKSSRLQR